MIRNRVVATLLQVWIASTFAVASAAAIEPERVVSYLPTSGRDFDRSYDLYRPAPASDTGTLVIFVHSRFWRERQVDRSIETSFVPALVRAGHSVAILRHRLLPSGQHPAAVQDVARGVAALLDRSLAGEFNRERVFLVGHSSGAQLALLLALDPAWLRAEGKSASDFAGVVSISGILDVGPGRANSEEEELIYAEMFSDPVARRAVSLASHMNPTLPAILLLTAANDVPGYRSAAMRLADELRAAGQPAVEAFIASARNHFTILELSDPANDARRHILEFLDGDPRAGRLPDSWRVLATWRDPPYTTEDFHSRFPDLVVEYPADERFNVVANRSFLKRPGGGLRFEASRYSAIDLFRLLDALRGSGIGEGDWLELRNVRREWAAFDIRQLRRFAPRVVVGVDSEHNLFRATDLYHTVRRYSWVDFEPKRVDMARPLGGFLYFPGEDPTSDGDNDHFGRYALTSDSFRLRSDDPYAALSDLPAELKTALTRSLACTACHQFRNVGGRALHLRADDGSRVGGRALPLERYPAIVWQRFIFDQTRVAQEVGAIPIEFDPAIGDALHRLVVEETQRRGIEAWTHPEREPSPD